MADEKWVKTKDPDALLDYLWDWSTYLGDDTITDAVFYVNDNPETTVDPDYVAIEDSSFTDTTATVWLSGGVVNIKSVITCHIVTAGGREDDRSLYLTIKEL